MATTVENLDKLERKITLTVPLETIRTEVESRLKRLARTVKMDGFRPGKVPVSVVAQRYGGSVQYEVVNSRVGEAFEAAANEANLRVAGTPRITEKDDAPAGELTFDAVFEVFPEVSIGDLANSEVEKVDAQVDDAAIDRTIDILRKQRSTFSQRSQDSAAADGDRATIDFEGKIDGEPFEGGKGADFQFMLGEGQMLKEFEEAVRGMKVGESRTFPLEFPADYHGKDVAGKAADFMVTVKKIEQAHLPEIDDALARTLGIADGSVDGLRADIRKNLEREVRQRVRAVNKSAVMEALLAASELELPKVSVKSEIDRLIEGARAELKQRGVPDADKMPIPDDAFRAQAERRVRLGLVVAELVRKHELQAKPEQVRSHIDELSASYEKPDEVRRWYYGEPARLNEVEAIVIENNVTDFVLGQAKVAEKTLAFDELMSKN